MSVFSGSRYEGALLTEVILPSGERRPYVHDRPKKVPPPRAGAISEVLGVGEMLDQLAYEHLGLEDLWWTIADINAILFPEIDESLDGGRNDLFVGRKLFIPSPDLGLGV